VQDKELIAKISKNNDNSAFNELINRHKDNVFSIVIGFLHDKDAANDIVQDVFLKFWEIRKDFKLTAKFSTWLYRVTVNKCINVQRKNKFSTVFSTFENKNNNENDISFEAQIPDNQQDTIDNKDKQNILKKNIENALNSLPKRQKIAFILNKYQNLSYKEIADVMELSVSSVEALLYRAKANLQKKLYKTYENLKNNRL
jgi:RNA polymerase sigma-70 factor (ECF subfamily)